MKKHKLGILVNHELTESEKKRYCLDNIFDVITIVRNKFGESLVIKNTNRECIYISEINGDEKSSKKTN